MTTMLPQLYYNAPAPSISVNNNSTSSSSSASQVNKQMKQVNKQTKQPNLFQCLHNQYKNCLLGYTEVLPRYSFVVDCHNRSSCRRIT